MKKTTFYTAPELEVISTAVEAGFSLSDGETSDFADAPYYDAGIF